MSRNGRLSGRIRLATEFTHLTLVPLPVARCSPLPPRFRAGSVSRFRFPVSCPPPAVSRPLVDDIVSRVLSPKRV